MRRMKVPMTKKVPKVVSKFHRLELTDDLRKMLMQLPVRKLVETQVGNHVYLADGEIMVGSRYFPVRIRVWKDDELRARVKSLKAGLDVESPFETQEDREAFPVLVRKAAEKCLN
jgi:hypothetical protein